MNNRTLLRSIAKHRMQGVPRLNRKYHAQGDPEKYSASPFARHWREAIGQKKTKPVKRTLFKRLFGKRTA